eukprot:6207438-Pleurochrysis_carterae.AAC.1
MPHCGSLAACSLSFRPFGFSVPSCWLVILASRQSLLFIYCTTTTILIYIENQGAREVAISSFVLHCTAVLLDSNLRRYGIDTDR